ECPAAGEDRHQVLERQALDRLSDRGAAHVELAPERVLVDGRAGGDPERHDAVAQCRVGPIGEQLARGVLSRPGSALIRSPPAGPPVDGSGRRLIYESSGYARSKRMSRKADAVII